MTGAAHKPKYIGLKVDLIDELPREGAMPSAEVVVIRLKDESPITPEELLYYLRGNEGYSRIQDVVRGSTGHLYPQDVEEIEVPGSSNHNATKLKETFWAAATAYRKFRKLEGIASDLMGGSKRPIE